MPFEALFLPADGTGDRGQRFCLFHAAQPDRDRPRGLVLQVHAFAEEMNKSRRMSALQARALAHAGYAVLQIDLLGCGDSSGDFADATWSDWLADVALAAHWLRQRHAAPLWLWGHRAGALVAAAAAQQMDLPCHFLFWQPATDGKQVLQQFLRLRLAADMHQGSAQAIMATLKASLAAGKSVEVAGYSLSAALATGLERSSLNLPTNSGGVSWLQVSQQQGAELSPRGKDLVEKWRAEGREVAVSQVAGPAFWQTSEIEDAPDLIAATLASMRQSEALSA